MVRARVIAMTIVIAAIAFRRFGLLGACVVPDGCCAGSTVVDPVERLAPVSVIAGERMLVSTSLAAGAKPNFAVPAFALDDPESLTRAVPSARQKASASSFSTRLHAGQRFMIS